MAGTEHATDMKAEPTIAHDKRLLDEESFQKLLEAAYVLQEHKDAVAAREPLSDYTRTLAEIVEIQNLIQAQHLDLDAAMKMVAEKAQRITLADGVAIGVVEGDQLQYRAGSGNGLDLVGSRMALDSSLAALSLYHGQILHTPQSERDPRFSPQICQQRQATSVIAVPVYHDGKVAAVVELACARANAFQEHDVRTCQLMAGLITEAIARNAEVEWKQALAVERATMIQALEQLKPQLERLAEEPEAPVEPAPIPLLREPAAAEPLAAPPARQTPMADPVSTAPAEPCQSCGHELESGEVFCGACGTARDTGAIQSKWATLWHMRVAEEQHEESSSERFPSMEEIRAELDRALPDLVAAIGKKEEPADELESPTEPETPAAPSYPEDAALVPSRPPATAPQEVWGSAVKARRWLDSLEAEQPAAKWVSNQWRAQRANIYLAAAAILLLAVIFARPQANSGAAASRSARTTDRVATGATPARPVDPRQNMTLFEKMLVGVGLAEAPQPPADQGNPGVEVWVDLHTALYYCPGAELYGKTPKGKFTTQKDAQQDQFEPASRKVCN